VTSFGSFVLWRRMLVVAPSGGPVWRIAWVMNRWERWTIGAALMGTAASVAHFWPMLHAFPKGADIPDSVMAGAVFVVVIPVYLFAGIVAVKGLRRLRPEEAAVIVEGASSEVDGLRPNLSR